MSSLVDPVGRAFCPQPEIGIGNAVAHANLQRFLMGEVPVDGAEASLHLARVLSQNMAATTASRPSPVASGREFPPSWCWPSH